MINLIEGINAVLANEDLWSDGKKILLRVKQGIEQLQAVNERLKKENIDLADNAGHNECILNGSWPQAIEILEKALKNAKALRKGDRRMAKTIHVTYAVRTPQVPNFLLLESGGNVGIEAIKEEGLREIGKEWTEELVKKAKERARALKG